MVSPDLGNAKTATQFARLLGLPVAAGSKQRLGDDSVVIDAIVGDVAGKRAIVLDDEIATGGSIVELLDRLEDLGCVDAAVACTHGLFVGKAVERLSSHPAISEVVTTDTVPGPGGWPELKVRSVAGLFAEAISRVHAGESVSSLFDGVDPAHGPPHPTLPVRRLTAFAPRRRGVGRSVTCLAPSGSAPATYWSAAVADAPIGIFDSGFGGSHGRPGGARPAAARAGALPRRHGAPAVRPEADR